MYYLFSNLAILLYKALEYRLQSQTALVEFQQEQSETATYAQGLCIREFNSWKVPFMYCPFKFLWINRYILISIGIYVCTSAYDMGTFHYTLWSGLITVAGVGGAVRFLVVGTIGQGERPPRG